MPIIFSVHLTTSCINFNIDSHIDFIGAQHAVNGKNKTYQNDRKNANGHANSHNIKNQIIAYNIPGHADAIFFLFLLIF